jgi:hypothetical protein
VTTSDSPRPTLGRIVHYRGKQGYQAPRCAIVTGTVDSLDPRGVESGAVPALDSDQHVHLWVFTPGEVGFPEYNIGPGTSPGEWSWLPAADGVYVRVADLARIADLTPGDTIVYRPQQNLSMQQVDELAADWERHLPGVRLLVVPPGDMLRSEAGRQAP